ncbi:cysteine hydrolase family protein [Rhodococcus sp. NPDC057529]|uniref:cysteine hydrolase family protein n=1 Tax=Rhodococcus sp. NPDC057529 TaxID=3346158 RepID=UPI00366A96A6
MSTSNDLVHFVYGEPRPLDTDGKFARYFAGRTAIVSIDMHDGHLSEDPDCPCPAPRGRDIIDSVDEFHRAARAAGIPVIHVRSELRPSGADDLRGQSPSAWRLTFTEHVGEIPGVAEHALSGSRWTTLSTQVEPTDEIVTGKKRLSAFYPTDLDFLLRQMSVTTVVLDGIMADCCVLNTAFDASNLGYRVIVARDLVRGTDQKLERAALDIMSLHLGLVMDAADLRSIWADTEPSSGAAAAARDRLQPLAPRR